MSINHSNNSMGNTKSAEISQFIRVKNDEGVVIKQNNVTREMYDLVDSNKSMYFYVAHVNVSEIYDYFLNYRRMELLKGGHTICGFTSIFMINTQNPDVYMNVNFTSGDYDTVRVYRNKKYVETKHINDLTDLSNLLTHILNINYAECESKNVKFDIMIAMK